MAGSIHNFQYKSNAGNDYVVRMDKSNGLAVGNTQLGNGSLPGLSDNIEPRYAIYQSVDRKVTRRIIVTSNAPNALATLPQSITDPVINANGSGAVFLTGFVNEKVKVYSTVDTGLVN